MWRKVEMLKKPLASILLAIVILFLVTHTALSQPELEITVTTQKKSYHYRQMVNVYGNVTYDDVLVEDGLVALQITFPHSLEGFNATRTVPANATPSQTWTIEIISVTTVDSSGNPQTVFNKGGNAWFKVITRNNDPFENITVLVTLTLCDVDSTPFKFHWLRITVPAGTNLTEMVRLDLDSYDGGNWVSTGTANAYANVYSTWPSMGGYPFCPEKSAAFTITSTAMQTIATPPTAPAPATTPAPTASSYNSYHASIRLPPNLPLGTYTITVSAYSRGFKNVYTTTTFNRDYELPGDVVYNRKVDIFDIVAVAAAYGTKGGIPNWNPEADFDKNGQVNVFDVVIVAGNYGVTY